jgi:ABC-type polysaccharide/polyol phosphate export permease
VLSQLFDFVIASTVIGIIVLAFGTGVSWQLLWLPLIFVGLLALVVGFAVLLSAASLFFRDVKYIVEVMLMFAVFFVPVVYESRMMGKWAPLVLVNPASPLLEATSATVDHHVPPDLGWLAYSLACAAVFLWGSFMLFMKLEPYFAESV